MKKNNTSLITDQVMSQIKSGRVSMKPKAYYSLLAVLSVSVVVFSGVAIAYLSSIMFYWFRVSSADTMAWGARSNLSESIAAFPWWVLIAATILLILSIILVRHQGRMYRHRISIVAVFIIISSLILGSLLATFDIGRIQTSGQSNIQNNNRGNYQNN